MNRFVALMAAIGTTTLPVVAFAQTPAAKSAASPLASGPLTFTLSANQQNVNVMKSAMPALPAFPLLTPKPGVVRGYVKDAKGHPLQGAVIGVRSSAAGGFYSGASAKSDAKGYYEITVPWGAASFYAAGYTVDYGEGRAALGLHPADGEADSFASANGHVENWVLLPYGIGDRDNASEQPQYAGNYYGGSLSIGYSISDPQSPDTYSLPSGGDIEVTLTPDGSLIDGSTGRSLVIHRHVKEGILDNFYINNVPLGQYHISAKILVNGDSKPLHLKETGPYANNPFGLNPKQGTDGVALTFRPGGAKAGMALAAHGNWDSLDITLTP